MRGGERKAASMGGKTPAQKFSFKKESEACISEESEPR